MPALQVEEAQAAQMLAESLAINSEVTVDGSNALTKEFMIPPQPRKHKRRHSPP